MKYSPETAMLLSNLKTISKKHILFGHQDATAYGVFWKDEEDRSDLKELTGSYPAVYGWDLGHIELGKGENLDGVSFDLIRREIVKAYERGGLSTISWHLRNPVNDSSAWDTSNYSVQKILSGGLVNEKYKIYLDRVADFLGNLKTSDGVLIPVIFRPFHEHTGSWFWWGKDFSTPEEYIALWHLTVNYLRKEKNLKNLLIAYSSADIQSKENYLERYPGDGYVDIIGFDDYSMNEDEYIKRSEINLAILTEIAKERNKISAFTETGSEQILNPFWYTEVLLPVIDKYPIAYVLVWRNANNRPNHYYVPYVGHSAETDFLKFFQSNKMWFGKDLSDSKLYR
jgi:mannan endo-1,4-beta-mannosidase